mmetsp:Transcript_64060/g.185640  ORF Transcript_64060/g.185640 Transcript_64060/m.185640 type:complete len:203 (+) Transcript_64060:546-1154(+)
MTRRDAHRQDLVKRALGEHRLIWDVQAAQVRRDEADAVLLRLRERGPSEDAEERALTHAALANEGDELSLLERHAPETHASASDRLVAALADTQGAKAHIEIQDSDGDIVQHLVRFATFLLKLLNGRLGSLMLRSAPPHPLPHVSRLVNDVRDDLKRWRIAEGLDSRTVDLVPQGADLCEHPETCQEDTGPRDALDDSQAIK